VKLLGGGSLNGIPVVSNRKFAAQVRLRFDEVALISGLVAHGDIRTMSGYPGLINIPVLSAALGNVTKDVEDGEIILLIKPKLLSLPSSELVTHEIWLGSETRPRMPM
jgi:type II secretory pathway component GspD/PulD (secretin)